jgi:hypothetical protein
LGEKGVAATANLLSELASAQQRSQPAVYAGDPVLVLIRQRLKLPDMAVLVGIASAGLLVILGGPAVAGSPLLGPSTVVALLYSFGLLPFAMWVYLALPETIEGMFSSLRATAINAGAASTSGEYDAFLERLRWWLGRRWWAVAAVVLVMVYWAYRPVWLVPAAIQGEVVPSAHLWLRIALLPVFSLPLYAFALSIARVFIALVFTLRLLREFRVNLDPLAPDGAGGWGPVGGMFTLTMIICIVVGGIALAMSAAIISVGLDPLEYLETRVLVALYLTLLPTALVVWLWLPHRALLQTRAAALRPIADSFSRAFEDARQLSAGGNLQEFKNKTDQLTEFKRCYDLLDASIPTWPLRLTALRGLSVSAFIPLITGLISAARTVSTGK